MGRRRRAAATVLAGLVILFGGIVGTWFALSAVLVALVTWPGLIVLLLLVVGLCWQATQPRRNT